MFCPMKNKNCKHSKPCSEKNTNSNLHKNGVDMSCKSDPNGSYTGTPKNKTERPTQDADDL